MSAGEPWSWNGAFCPDRGPENLSGLHLASPKFPKNCPDFWFGLFFTQKMAGSAGSGLNFLLNANRSDKDIIEQSKVVATISSQCYSSLTWYRRVFPCQQCWTSLRHQTECHSKVWQAGGCKNLNMFSMRGCMIWVTNAHKKDTCFLHHCWCCQRSICTIPRWKISGYPGSCLRVRKCILHFAGNMVWLIPLV